MRESLRYAENAMLLPRDSGDHPFPRWFQASLADRPLLLLGVLLIVVGIQLLSLGLVADVVSRTYHESQDKRPYNVRERKVGVGGGVKSLAPGFQGVPLPTVTRGV
jgi:hypothetical protein